jgi:hypothetical protein
MAEVFSVVAALATVVQACALVVLHFLPTGYDPVRDAVSDYGVGPYRGWFWLQTIGGGVGCLALGIALTQLHPFTPTQAVVALVVTAAAGFSSRSSPPTSTAASSRPCTGSFT